jgi:hypothetical protein
MTAPLIIPMAMRAWPQFVTTMGGVPVDPVTLIPHDAHAPTHWLDADTVERLVTESLAGLHVGFVLTANDPFFFVDLDDAMTPAGTWSPFALDVCARFPGAAMEVSRSGRGLHIFGIASMMLHRCRRKGVPLELYTAGRVATLTGTGAQGDAGLDYTAQLAALVADLLPPGAETETDWTAGPVAGWAGIRDDDELIARACESRSAAATFGGAAGFAGLWTANADALGRSYPPAKSDQTHDGSAADAALAQHLAFWTGNDCERIERLMWRSALVRPKWDRDGYLRDTITGACGRQVEFHGMPIKPTVTPATDATPAPKLRASTDRQREFASTVRETVLAAATPAERDALTASRGPTATASFWLDNKGRAPAELAAMVTVAPDLQGAPTASAVAGGPRRVSGMQYLTPDAQLEKFAGCAYVQDMHRILTPDGSLLRPDQFNATFGGYLFALDAIGVKDTRKAWEAFTESQVLRWPKVSGLCFRPGVPTGEVVELDGRQIVNCYVEIKTERRAGDPAPFLEHVARLLPDENDRRILIAYMAACVQFKGVKFQWAPLIQGCEGNGKTLLTRCVAFAIGKRYTHYPNAADIDNKFNGWLLNKLFIGVEDIYVPDHRLEVIEALKPIITGGDGLEIQLKGADQVTADICANFMLNSNHRDAIRKTHNDRRFAVFYTAQQKAGDLARDGMHGDYFPNLYDWLRREGYAIVNEYLATYPIPDDLNPATRCQRAPTTSTTIEAVAASMGGVEQEVVEAVAEGRPGFMGGWISTVALDNVLRERGLSRRVPPNKRGELLEALGYEHHPGLPGGRPNNPIMIDGGKKPRLFIRTDSPARLIVGGANIVARYVADQAGGGASDTDSDDF